ncbi:MAG: STAS domain-containing protein [Actinomycetota bacterium]|nr:STAS domain-containing protein [Actinomycetota bacterium]
MAVDGELDACTAPILAERLADLIDAQGNLNVVLDLSATTFIDSSGLTALVTAHKALRSRGGRFAVAAPTAPVRRLLEITGLDRVLTVAQRRFSLSV